jgi:uncharacterized glyoxalase superfamily protein PhnB
MFDPAKGYPSIVPYLRYRDPNAAVRWLCDVFGFTEAVRFTMRDGTIGHAELVHSRFIVSVGYAPQPMPAEHGCVTSMVLVFVGDVDTTCAHAVAAGGTVISAAKDQPWGLRQAVIADPAGYQWEVSQHQHDVASEEWGAALLAPIPG